MPRWLVLLCVAGCAHETAPAPIAAKPPSVCEQVADHVVGLMSAAQQAKPEELDPFRNVITKRCTEDHWSDQAQQCLRGIKDLPEGDKCEKLLTEDQAKSLERDGQAAAGAIKPSNQPPPAPTTGAPTPAAAAPMAPAPAPPPPQADEAKSFRKAKAKKAKSAPGASSDPCEGGE
jgi:hypothetical protein